MAQGSSSNGNNHRRWAMTASSLLATMIVLPTLVVGGLTAFATAASSPTTRGGATAAGEPSRPRMHRGLERKTSYVILEEIAHDPHAFTQGLVYEEYDGQPTFLEGTGLHGQSSLRRVNVKNGDVLKNVPVDRKFFGEGIVAVDDKIVQITWESKKALIYGRQNLTLIKEVSYDTTNGEGWGITTDGKRLIVSDGSANILFWNKDTYQQEGAPLVVKDGFDKEVNKLNELEWAYGYIWANVWLSDDIVQIDPTTGKIVAFYDFSSLYPSSNRYSVDQVLNGIAYDPTEDVFYLTGKWWPSYYKIKMCGFSQKEGEENGVCKVNAEGGKQ